MFRLRRLVPNAPRPRHADEGEYPLALKERVAYRYGHLDNALR
jgi:hypothetical protein